MPKKFYIKERRNPQTGTYYTLCGQLTKKAAKEAEGSLYGRNIMHAYDTEEEYLKAIEDLKQKGERVR